MAWELTFLANLFNPHRQGGSEMELEAIRASLNSQDGLTSKTRGIGGGRKDTDKDKDKKGGLGGKGGGKGEEEGDYWGGVLEWDMYQTRRAR